MDLDRIKSLIDAMAASDLAGHTSSEATPNIVAPLFGTVYLQPEPNAPAFVTAGQAVKAGTPLCVIEAMKMFHEVRADRDGTITEILVASGQEVEAGQQLMRMV
jgi:acetyl-CoA carboxylase biotin carboxyl carrier protein